MTIAAGFPRGKWSELPIGNIPMGQEGGTINEEIQKVWLSVLFCFQTFCRWWVVLVGLSLTTKVLPVSWCTTSRSTSTRSSSTSRSLWNPSRLCSRRKTTFSLFFLMYFLAFWYGLVHVCSTQPGVRWEWVTHYAHDFTLVSCSLAVGFVWKWHVVFLYLLEFIQLNFLFDCVPIQALCFDIVE